MAKEAPYVQRFVVGLKEGNAIRCTDGAYVFDELETERIIFYVLEVGEKCVKSELSPAHFRVLLSDGG